MINIRMMKNMPGIIQINLLWQICLYLFVNVQETFQSPNLLDTHQSKKGYIQVPNCNCTIDECDYYLSWEKVSDTEISFEYSAKVNDDTPWIAFGLNTQPQMPNTSVIDCIVDGSKFIIQASYNPDHYNSVLNNNQLGLVKGSLAGRYSPGRVYCNFTRLISVNKSDPESSRVDDLQKPYYVLFAHGKADNGIKREHDQSPFVSTTEVNFLKQNNSYREDGWISRSPYIKAHATIMIVAWMVLASFGIVTSRYLQKEWMKGITIRGKPLWFRIHQFCVLATLGLTFAGVLIIFKGLNWSFKPPELHPLLGLIVAGLLVLNPIIGFARPPLDSPNRPAFHWIHGIIGHGTHLLSVVAMFFGLRHGQPTMLDWGGWVVIGFGVWRISIDIVLSIMARFDRDPFDYRAMADREEGTHEKWSSWRCSIVVIYMVVTIAAALSLVVFVNLDYKIYKEICIS